MSHDSTFLHVGCGTSRRIPWVFADWGEIRVDIDPDVSPDVVASTTDLSVIADASTDGIFTAHTLEHLDPAQVPVALREFRRVLKPSGLLLLVVPDLQSVAEALAAQRLDEPLYESPAGPIAAIDIIYGMRGSAEGNPHMLHRTGFVARSLVKAFERAGFHRTIVQRHFYSLWAMGLAGAEATQPCSHPAMACAPVKPAS